jgi:hypothetical protein
VAFPEDQHVVGDFGPGGEDEPFGVGVRAGTSGGIFSAWIPVLARTASKDPVNCPARSRTGNRKSAAPWTDILIITTALATIVVEDLGGAAWLEEISPGLTDAEARHQAAIQD